jgi:hypothetical protein
MTKFDRKDLCAICGKPLRKCPYCGSWFCVNDDCKRCDSDHIAACRDNNKA